MSRSAITLGVDVLQWQGLSEHVPEPVFSHISCFDSTNTFVRTRIRVRPFVVVLSLLSGFHGSIFPLSLILLFRAFSHDRSIILVVVSFVVLLSLHSGFAGLVFRLSFILLVRAFSHGKSIVPVVVFPVTVLGLELALRQRWGSTSIEAMPAKGRDNTLIGTMAALQRQRAEMAKAEQETRNRERMRQGDPHDVQSVKDDAERRRKQKAKDLEAQATREEVRRSRQKAARQQEAQTNWLLDGIQSLNIDTKLTDGMFEAAASYLQKLTTGSGRIAQVAEMTRTDFIATMKLALQVSMLQAMKVDQQTRITRSLQALDDAAWRKTLVRQEHICRTNDDGTGDQ